MTTDNPYGGSGVAYSANVNFAQAVPFVVKDVTTASFPVDVIQASRKTAVLVDFWAPWCGPCKQLAPLLEKVVGESGGAVTLVKMNIDEHPAIAGQLGIQSIPAVIAFRDGQPVDGFMGAVPESQIRDFVKRVGGNGKSEKDQIAAALAAAAAARDGGDRDHATEFYAAILERAPETVEAIAGLADLLFEAGETERANAVLDGTPADKAGSPPIAAIRAKMKLAAETALLGDPEEFERRLAADPGDHQARFDLAMIQNAKGDREAAADNLLAIIKADRSWNEGAARTKLLQLFEAWGLMDDATLAARRKLSSLLFS